MSLFAKCAHHPACLHPWARTEEMTNILSHSVGFFLAIAALVCLIIQASLHGSALSVVCCVVFGTSLVIAYGASSIYHSANLIAPKRILKAIDHIAIYILIAGTYTPFMLVALGGAWGWSLFGVVWALAVAGTVFKLIFLERYETISTLIYVLMGWLALIAIVPILNQFSPHCLAWVLAGGILYTIGVVFFLMETVPFAHTIWHFFVLMGSTCHFFAVLWYVAPDTFIS